MASLDPGFIASQLDPTIRAVCPIISVGIGDPANRETWTILFDPSATSAETTAALQVLADWVIPTPIPQQVPMWAAQAALKQAGKYDAINAAIIGDPTASPPVPSMETSDAPVFFAWTMGNFASRQSTFIATLASQFGMAAADIDAVFVAAQEIAKVAG